MVQRMEEIMNPNEAVQQASQAASSAITSFADAGTLEVTCALVLPILALLIGRLVNRWLDQHPKESWIPKFFDFLGPLLAPTLAVIFLTSIGYTLRGLDYELYILPFVWKLAVAWFAIQLVALVSSRQGTGWMVVLVIAPITLMHLFGVWEPVTRSLSDIEFTVGDTKLNLYGILKSIMALIALFWVAGFAVQATDARLRRIRRIHVSNRVLIMKFFQIVLYFVVFLIGLQILGVSLTALSVLGGALGVGIGFGLQKIASNFISGIILLFEKSVSVDDMIQLEDGTVGFIRQNAARYTLIEVADGREIMIPNEEFITQRVTTLTHSNKRGRVDVTVGVGYESDLQLTLKLLVQAADTVKSVMKDPTPIAWVIGFGDSAINTQLSFWVENVTDGKNTPRSDVLIEIVRLFRENSIDIPYPHQVQVDKASADAQQPPKKSTIVATGDAKEKKKPSTTAKK